MQRETLLKRRGFKVNPRGRLEFGGCDIVNLAHSYGTPLYVVNENIIRSKARQYCKALTAYYSNWGLAYAGKAFLPIWMCEIAREEGLHLDVASGGELYTALKAGFPPDRILFHGNNKSYDEIKMGLRVGVGRFIIDNWLEIDMLSSLARRMNKKPNVLIRVAPGVEAHTHTYIETGRLDSKFGFGIYDDKSALGAVGTILKEGVLNLMGVHSHIGSQITTMDGPVLAAKRMVGFLARIKKELNFEALELNLGGGLGVAHTLDEVSPSIKAYVEVLTASVMDAAQKGGLQKLPRLFLEPGRSIVGEAGITLYTVGAIKHIPGVRTFASLDGGMADNPRPALYNAVYEAVVADRPLDDFAETLCFAGKCCESDILIHEARVPTVRAGDTVAVLSTGAYCYSMASGYNMLPRPAVVAVSKGKARLVVRRQSYDDLLACESVQTKGSRRGVAASFPAGAVDDD